MGMSNSRPDVIGTHMGGLDISQGASWSPLTSASFDDMTSVVNDAASLPANLRFTEVTIRNTDAANTLYVMLGTLNGAIPSVTNRIPILFGASLTIPCYGVFPLSISIRGSAPGVTGHVLAQFVSVA